MSNINLTGWGFGWITMEWEASAIAVLLYGVRWRLALANTHFITGEQEKPWIRVATRL